MSQEVRILHWCDKHEQVDEEQVEGDSQAISINGIDFEVDFCPRCVEDLLAPLETVLEQVARRPKDRKRKASGRARPQEAVEDDESHLPPSSRKAPCPYCPQVLQGRSSLRGHMESKHDTTLAEYEAQQAAQEGGAHEYTCPECRHEGKMVAFVNNRSLGAHRFQKHGVAGRSKTTQQTRKAS